MRERESFQLAGHWMERGRAGTPGHRLRFLSFTVASPLSPALALRRAESRPQSGHVRSFRDPGAVLTFWLARRKNKSARVPGKGEGGKDEGEGSSTRSKMDNGVRTRAQ